MDEYIDRTEIFKGCSFIIPEKADAAATVQKLLEHINSIPAADVVSSGVLAQVQWERDVAVDQLKSYGVGFAEKADVARVKHGKWYRHDKKIHGDTCYHCSECERMPLTDCGMVWELTPYCPFCGAKMDGIK